MKIRSVVERYYSQYFFTSDGGEDQYVNQHFNGICVVGLAPGHPVIRENKPVTGMYYGPAKLRNKVTGKAKKGGMWVDPTTTLCVIGCTDCRYIAKCGIRGELLEINTKVLNKPEVMVQYPQGEGFLALIMPKRGLEHAVTSNLITFDEYYDDRPYLTKPKMCDDDDDFLNSDFDDIVEEVENLEIAKSNMDTDE